MAFMKSTCHVGDESKAESYEDSDKISREVFSLLERNWLLQQHGSSCHAEKLKSAEAGKRVCILSIDGGGMRGILACRYLIYLQNALKIKTGDPNARISDYFDIAAGTNIGGIMVAALFAKGENGGALYTAQEMMDFIVEKGKHIFQVQSSRGLLDKLIRQIKAAKRSTKSLGRTLQGLFSRSDGQPLTLRDTLKPILIPCYDLCSASPFLFAEASAKHTQNFNFNMWEVCHATMCSPGFEKPITMKSLNGQTTIVGIDGGLVTNNPTAAAITHVMNNKVDFPSVKGMADILVLSLGGGEVDCPYKYEQVKSWGILEWAKPIMNIVSAGVSDIVDHAVSVLFRHNPQNYVRLQVTMKASGGVSERVLMELAEETLKEKSTESMDTPFGWRRRVPQSNAERLDWFAEQLAMEHRSRAATKMIS